MTGETKLAESAAVSHHGVMSRREVEKALESNAPFIVRMADGKEYPVPHHDYISLPPTGSYVVVYDSDGAFNYLPLLTMTGLTIQERKAN